MENGRKRGTGLWTFDGHGDRRRAGTSAGGGAFIGCLGVGQHAAPCGAVRSASVPWWLQLGRSCRATQGWGAHAAVAAPDEPRQRGAPPPGAARYRSRVTLQMKWRPSYARARYRSRLALET